MIKILKMVGYSAVILFLAWFVISYIDILAYNLDGGSDHMWNIFYVLMGGKS